MEREGASTSVTHAFCGWSGCSSSPYSSGHLGEREVESTGALAEGRRWCRIQLRHEAHAEEEVTSASFQPKRRILTKLCAERKSDAPAVARAENAEEDVRGVDLVHAQRERLAWRGGLLGGHAPSQVNVHNMNEVLRRPLLLQEWTGWRA